MSTISERLINARKAKNLTQKQLSQVTGISEVMISQYERSIRSPKLTQLKKFADALDVSTNYLSGIDEENIVNEDGASTVLKFETTISDLRESIKYHQLMQKYKEMFDELDDFGKDLVLTVITKEYERCVHFEEKDHNND